MRNDKLSVQSMDFAVAIITLAKELEQKKETIVSNQIGRSGTSIGANIREAQYAHGKAGYITEPQYKALDSFCTSIRVMLIASINTAKGNKL